MILNVLYSILEIIIKQKIEYIYCDIFHLILIYSLKV